MSNLFWLIDGQVAWFRPYFPKSHRKPRIDDRCVLSGIIFINNNGSRRSDAPEVCGAPKAPYNRLKRWNRVGVFAKNLTELAAQTQETKVIMIDAPHAKAHRTTSTLAVQKGTRTADQAHKGRAELQSAHPSRCEGPPYPDVPIGGSDLGLHSRAGASVTHPGGQGAVGRPRLRRRLVPQRADKNGSFPTHPIPRKAEGHDFARYRLLPHAP